MHDFVRGTGALAKVAHVLLTTRIFSVHFRYVVFRPFLDEVLVGKIRSSSKEGVSGKIKNLILRMVLLRNQSIFIPNKFKVCTSLFG